MSNKFPIQFILNADLVTAEVPTGTLVLDFIRDQRHLSGTKEGCRGGDCGACIVLVGELESAWADKSGESSLEKNAVKSGMHYQPMTSCLLPVGDLQGKHLVTIEGLRGARNATCVKAVDPEDSGSGGEQLSTVQAAMIECGGTQCGYCTPGFIMSLTGWIADPGQPLDRNGFNQAISGNLCRCTGYNSIRKAGQRIADSLSDLVQRVDRIEALCERGELPAYFLGIERRLLELSQSSFPSDARGKDAVPITGGAAIRVAGGTNFFLEQGAQAQTMALDLFQCSAPAAAVVDENNWLIVDARMSFESFGRDPLVQDAIPDIQIYNELIASWPIRIRATLAGNLCNASPSGDLTCLMLALGAELGLEGDDGKRSLPLREFYLGYRRINKTDNEILRTIQFPQPSINAFVGWQKISKRPHLDIATVNSAVVVELEGKRRIRSARLAVGGVAEIPLLLDKTGQLLTDKELDVELLFEALAWAQKEIAPISDIRGSADYKRLLVRQQLLAHFMRGFPEHISEDIVFEALR